jgi:hypothetical protein
MDGSAITDSCEDLKCCPVSYKDRLSLIDWKTSNYLYLEYIMQVAAYDWADREENGNEYDDAWVIRLGKEDGEFDPWHLEAEDLVVGLEGFLLCLELGRKVEQIEARQKARKQAIAIVKKHETEKRRIEKLKKECAGAKKYKGVRAPKCNGGNPCQSCLTKYAEAQRAKSNPVADPGDDRPWALMLGVGSPALEAGRSVLPGSVTLVHHFVSPNFEVDKEIEV